MQNEDSEEKVAILDSPSKDEDPNGCSLPKDDVSKSKAIKKNKWAKLEDIFHEKYSENAPLVLLHPGDDRSYTDEELDHLRERDFVARMLICRDSCCGKSISLRTHFSDNHKFESHLNYIRDYFKAEHLTQNYTAAKTTVSELLTIFFTLNESQYYSFAITIASALSNCGENTSFQPYDNLLTTKHQADEARRKLCLLMHVLFTKVSMYNFLIKNNGNNTYRLVHCGTKSYQNKKPLFYALFSFLIQLCLTGYVIAENISTAEDLHLRNLPLAVLTFIYSAMIAYPGLVDSHNAFDLYGKIGPLQMTDFFVNQFLTFVLLFSGFFVIMIQESFIEAVLNTAALLFIPEIDDQLPQLLGLNGEEIIKNYLTYQSLKEFDKICQTDDSKITTSYLKSINSSIGVEFGDYYLTNIDESPSYPEDGIIFTPYQVRPGHDGLGHQVEASNFITHHCLIRKLIWSYTTLYPNSTKPRIGYLKIEKLDGEVIEIFRKGDSNVKVSDVKHSLNGVFIITSFQMSDDIIRLRVCGSDTSKNFLRAMEYYSLWGLNSSARKALDNDSKKKKKKNCHGKELREELNNYYYRMDSFRETLHYDHSLM